MRDVEGIPRDQKEIDQRWRTLLQEVKIKESLDRQGDLVRKLKVRTNITITTLFIF